MNKGLLIRHKSNKRELEAVKKRLTKLYRRLEEVPVVSGKVTKSSDDFPYIEEHVAVQMEEPRESTMIKNRIREYEKRQLELEREIQEVEEFVDHLPEGVEKQIFEMIYLERFTQKEAAEMIGYTQSMISKIIKKRMKDS